MTHRGPFQPLLFCDSVILCDSVKSVCTPKKAGKPQTGPGAGPWVIPPLASQIAVAAPRARACARAAGRVRAANVPRATTPASTAEG